MKNLKFLIAILTFYIFNFYGCATTPYVRPTPPPGIPGIYHRVERGQTLWRLSKIYAVELDELIKTNRISDATNIEVGQLIFIPHRQKAQISAAKFLGDDFIWPLKGTVIATFGSTHNNMLNKGINIQPYSNPDVLAARPGKVIFANDNFGSFGKTIIIDHGDGFSTVYARNAQIFAKAGDRIEKGTIIAKAGAAGRDKKTYLHFEIRKGHIPQNPYYYLP